MKDNKMRPDATAMIAQKRITLDNGRLLQVGALVYRPLPQNRAFDLDKMNHRHEILLITSRGSKRWIIPKGWPMPGRTLAQAALREAYEEAGIHGVTEGRECGFYPYTKKDIPESKNNRFHVMVFAVLCQNQKKKWPEQKQRLIEWVSPLEAAARVEEDELKKLLLRFTPTTRPG